MQELQKVLNTLDYKCWYYDQAIKEHTEANVKNMSVDQMPIEIQEKYKAR